MKNQEEVTMLKSVSGREAFRNKCGNEHKKLKAFRHICDDLSEQEIKRQGLEVYLYKAQAFVLVKWIGTFGVAEAGDIKYCPYCGVEIEKEMELC